MKVLPPIIKTAVVNLTEKEIESPNPIEIKLTIKGYNGDSITYTITYPKS